MLTDPKLRSQIDQLWDKLWTGGLSNPLDAIEQLSYLIFLKRLDDAENQRERQAQRRGQPYQPRVPGEMRWRHWTHFEGRPKRWRTSKTRSFPGSRRWARKAAPSSAT